MSLGSKKTKITFVGLRGELIHTKIKFVDHWLSLRDEGIKWCRGWDDESEQARALLAVYAFNEDEKSAR